MRRSSLTQFISVFLIGIFLFSTCVPAGFAETVYFYHNDHLGSPLAMTDMQGNVVWRRDYKPFGQEIDPGGATTANTHKYTGKEFDAETGLYYYGARYYDPTIGRFISVDPAGGKPEMPQTWNRYVYTLNNPYKYVDPDGRWPAEVHNSIIDETFKGRFGESRYALPGNITNIFKEASRYVDRSENQSLENSYQHAMRAPNQTVEEAEKQMNDFKRQKITEYRNLLSEGKYDAAYFSLGEGMHAIMDSTSPVHEGFQVWEGIWGHPIKAMEHGEREAVEVFDSNPEYMKNTVGKLREFFDEANKK